MTRVAFVHMYPGDWRTGCMGLTLEQEGLYMRMCMFVSDTNRRVPLDDTEAARMLSTQTRNYRRVLGELLRLGKITRHDDGYSNDRAEHERDVAARAIDKKSASRPTKTSRKGEGDTGSERQDREATGVVTEVQRTCNGVISDLAAEIPQSNQRPLREPESEPYKSTDDTREREKPRVAKETFDNLKAIADRCIAAGGDVLANPQSSMGLMDLSTIAMWQREGCNIETDILPAIASVSKRRKGRAPITSWGYFSAAVGDAKARREGGMPVTAHAMAGAFRQASEEPEWLREKNRRKREVAEWFASPRTPTPENIGSA